MYIEIQILVIGSDSAVESAGVMRGCEGVKSFIKFYHSGRANFTPQRVKCPAVGPSSACAIILAWRARSAVCRWGTRGRCLRPAAQCAIRIPRRDGLFADGRYPLSADPV